MAYRRGARGVTLIETLVSVAILGVGVLSLTRMTVFSEHGLAESRTRVDAQKLAEQRAERLVALATTDLPTCPTAEGCRQSRTAYSPAKAPDATYPCTEMVDGMSVADPTVAGPAEAKFRVDTTVVAHPDPGQLAGAQVITVSACWTDLDGTVQEVQVQRMLVPEI